MKKISPDSMDQRVQWLKRNVDQGCLFLSKKSDYQLAKGQLTACYSLIFYFGFFLFNTGIDLILKVEKWYDWRLMIVAGIFVFFIHLIIRSFRWKWAIQAFEQFAPQTFEELSQRIAEEKGADHSASSAS